ncbi:MAG: tRNA (guanosine(46)-N7)-methyltransferase TrmB [Bacteroidales bacterium]|nr:tRNA (guanosine(46)-N7)-methyltransferase TrmB [Bacteroidales bacterium]
MGKNKLKKFREMEQLDRVYQFPFGALQGKECPLKGRWNAEVFGNDNPIVLELGCGKGEYTVGMARHYRDKNFIGIDVKGARMWSGARIANDENITNAAFLRTNIELLPLFFAPGEVSEIWITFPDPQMKKVRKRLTSTRFMELYRQIMVPDGLVHLKTDSPFLYTYTDAMTAHNGLTPLKNFSDLYSSEDADSPILRIRTHYEQQWLQRGLTIKYIVFPLDHTTALTEPEIEIPYDTYRSYSRGELQL